MQVADAVGHSRREGAEQEEQEQRDDDAVSMCSNETPVAVSFLGVFFFQNPALLPSQTRTWPYLNLAWVWT